MHLSPSLSWGPLIHTEPHHIRLRSTNIIIVNGAPKTLGIAMLVMFVERLIPYQSPELRKMQFQEFTPSRRALARSIVVDQEWSVPMADAVRFHRVPMD